MRYFFTILIFAIFSCKTVNNSTSEKVITVDTNLENPGVVEYKQLVESYGDTAVTYDGDLIILEGRSYVSLGTTAWINRKVVIVYK